MTALEASCDTYFYQLGYKFFQLPKDRGHPLQAWASASGSASRPGSTSPARRGSVADARSGASARTPGRRTKQWQLDRLWKPGDSISLPSVRRTCTDTAPARARLRDDRERRQARHSACGRRRRAKDERQRAAVVLRHVPVRRPEPVGVDPAALAAVRDGLLRGDPRNERNGDRGLRELPEPDRGQNGNGREGRQLPPKASPRWSASRGGAATDRSRIRSSSSAR